MKLKLMAFAFILAFAVASFGALGVSGAHALIVTTPGQCVVAPDEAIPGAITGFSAVTGAGVDTPLVVDFGSSVCP